MEGKNIIENFLNKKEIEINLVTNLPEEYQIKNNKITIPFNFDKLQMNNLINKLLKNDKNNLKNFSFFIGNKLLETTINECIITNKEEFNIQKISEEGIEIVYSFELNEPEKIKTIKEDEWIKNISVRINNNTDYNSNEYFAVGLFNSEVTIYDKKFEKLFKIEDSSSNKEENFCELLHDLVLFENNDLTFLIKASRNEESNFRIYLLDLLSSNFKQIFLNPKKSIEYVNCLSINPVDHSYFCSGDTEGNINIYRIPDMKENNINKNKKRKIQIDQIVADVQISDNNLEKKHIKWLNNQQIISSSDEFFIKLWNIHTRTNLTSFNTNYKYTTCLTSIENGEGRFISGHEDGSIKIWDTKANNKPVITYLQAHSNYVSNIATNPNIDNYSNIFTSVAYDSTMKVWDLRSNKKSLFTIKTDSEKNYAVGFNSVNYLISGGDSSNINIYENKQ